jgi:hypothetical protein
MHGLGLLVGTFSTSSRPALWAAAGRRPPSAGTRTDVVGQPGQGRFHGWQVGRTSWGTDVFIVARPRRAIRRSSQVITGCWYDVDH